MTYPQCNLAELIRLYRDYTTKVMPQMAGKPEIQWPVQNDHCFQRIILDAVCNGIWYDYLERPAYKNLTQDQAFRAVQLCKEIVAGRANLHALNRQSLIWRGKKSGNY